MTDWNEIARKEVQKMLNAEKDPKKRNVIKARFYSVLYAASPKTLDKVIKCD